jgi:hypothetical protein
MDPDLDWARVRAAWDWTRRALTAIITDEGVEEVVRALECESPALRLVAAPPITSASEFG